ncbi:Hypp6629 [Branchiostoma lanceolatum]|uniref:Hypp6629 protein n=1 Tax=Branchiostoma lanceolatum TaxID=7740 RepID=A0A8K0EAZ7_BRALA|nr:Hypp6629 [Branchiostoma lanceolatum]
MTDATYCSEIEGPRAVGVPLHSTPVNDTEFSELFDCETCPPDEYDSDATYCSEIEGPRAVGVPLHSTPINDTEFSELFDCETCPPDLDE